MRNPARPTTTTPDPETLVALAASATLELDRVDLELASTPLCRAHGDPFSHGSCVEHDIDGRCEIEALATTCRRIHRKLRALTNSDHIDDILGDLDQLRSHRRGLRTALVHIPRHSTAMVFHDALTACDQLAAALADAVHA